MADTPRLNERFLACLQEKGWTMAQASRACGVHYGCFSNLKYLRTSPSDERADQIARVFGKSGADIFPEEYREIGRACCRGSYKPTPRPVHLPYHDAKRLNTSFNHALKEKGWSVAYFSKQSGIQSLILSQYLCCKSRISKKRADYIASFFGKRGVDLFPPAYHELAKMYCQEKDQEQKPEPSHDSIDHHADTLDELARKHLREEQQQDYRHELLHLALAAIADLPAHRRELIYAVLFDGRTYREIADGGHKQAVQQRYARTLLAVYAKMREIAAGSTKLPPVADTLRTVQEDNRRKRKGASREDEDA